MFDFIGDIRMKMQHSFIYDIFLFVIKLLSILAKKLYAWMRPPIEKDVSGEVVLITGSGKGLGRELAIKFARKGAIVVLWDIDSGSIEQTFQDIIKAGGVCYKYTCDVSSKKAIYDVAARVQKEVGDVTILGNNAGIVVGKSILQTEDASIEKTMNVNLMAQIWTTRAFLPAMVERNHGHIVNVASSAGLAGISNLADYSASKFGVVGFTEVLHYEMEFSGYSGVKTTSVCPGIINTGMFNGCKMRNQKQFDSLMPTLEVDETVDIMMKAILTNKTMVCMPKMVHLFACIKTVLPTELMVEIVRLCGADSFMESFKCTKSRAYANQ